LQAWGRGEVFDRAGVCSAMDSRFERDRILNVTGFPQWVRVQNGVVCGSELWAEYRKEHWGR
jgi:hypothetical protein